MLTARPPAAKAAGPRRGLARGGDSIGLIGGHAGTLGCLVRVDGDVMLLSCAHILTTDGQGRRGEDVWRLGTGEVARDTIADVYGTACDLQFNGVLNPWDAALAEVRPGAVDAAIGDWGPPTGLSSDIAKGRQVYCYGAVTGGTSAWIDEPYANPELPYFDGRILRFQDLVRCTPAYSLKGDSGAAVVDADMKFLGIHVGGDAAASYFCPLWRLRDRWEDLTVVTRL